jgi:glucosamine 6-phosphate synthetase-like amidotransferase/phosphosugar isomerase protein
MCAIIGHIGTRQATPILFSASTKLEYRGHDSCGIALGGDYVKICKDTVRVGLLQAVSPSLLKYIGPCILVEATRQKASALGDIGTSP